MTIYVDKPQFIKGSLLQGWCNMMISKDADLQKLHDFAESIGLRLRWLHSNERTPHYELPPSERKLAIKRGATVVGDIELVDKCFRGEVKMNEARKLALRAQKTLQQRREKE